MGIFSYAIHTSSLAVERLPVVCDKVMYVASCECTFFWYWEVRACPQTIDASSFGVICLSMLPAAFLCEAEDYASMCNIVAAKESYELSAKTARDHGLVHEQGLACEVSFETLFLSLLPKKVVASHPRGIMTFSPFHCTRAVICQVLILHIRNIRCSTLVSTGIYILHPMGCQGQG